MVMFNCPECVNELYHTMHSVNSLTSTMSGILRSCHLWQEAIYYRNKLLYMQYLKNSNYQVECFDTIRGAAILIN